MKLVDHRIAPGNAERLHRDGIPGRDDAFGRIGGTVAGLEAQIGGRVVRSVTEMRRREREAPVQGSRIGVDQELVGIEPVPPRWVVRPMDAVTIALAGLHAVDMDAPYIPGPFEAVTGGFVRARSIEKAQLDLFGMRRKQDKEGAARVAGGP